MIVYLITNRVNGKRYVGQSETNLETRWEKHVACSRCPRSNAYKRMPIVRAIAKHGAENFDNEVIEECDSYEAMDAAEIRWIAELNTTDPKVGYNVSKGGDAPMRGRKHRADSIEKMREAKRNPSDETRAAIRAGQARANADPNVIARKSEAAKNWIAERGFTTEHRAKISKANSGENSHFYGKRFGRSANPTPHTEEAKRRISEAHQGKVLTDEHKAAISKGCAGRISPNLGKQFDDLWKFKMTHSHKHPIVITCQQTELFTALSFDDALVSLREMGVKIGRLRLKRSMKSGSEERGYRFRSLGANINELRQQR